jgi:hypothetical protein
MEGGSEDEHDARGQVMVPERREGGSFVGIAPCLWCDVFASLRGSLVTSLCDCRVYW